MTKNSSTDCLRDKLRATIEAKRISRIGIEEAENKLNELIKQRKKLHAKKANVSKLDIMIEVLEEEINKITEASSNTQHGCPIDGGVGFGSGGGAGTDSG